MSSPILEYENPRVGQARRRRRLLLAAAAAVLLVMALTTLTRSRSRHYPSHIRCASNLRTIGVALLLYTNENGGALPPDLGLLVETQDLPLSNLVCHSTDHVPLTGTPSAHELRAALAAGGHCSYVYVGGVGTLASMGSDEVMAFEPVANHQTKFNVLFADGRCDFVDAKHELRILEQLAAGKRPVVLKLP